MTLATNYCPYCGREIPGFPTRQSKPGQYCFDDCPEGEGKRISLLPKPVEKEGKIMDAKEIYEGVTGNPYPTSPHEWMSVKAMEERDGRIAELEAALRPFADAYQDDRVLLGLEINQKGRGGEIQGI